MLVDAYQQHPFCQIDWLDVKASGKDEKQKIEEALEGVSGKEATLNQPKHQEKHVGRIAQKLPKNFSALPYANMCPFAQTHVIRSTISICIIRMCLLYYATFGSRLTYRSCLISYCNLCSCFCA